MPPSTPPSDRDRSSAACVYEFKVFPDTLGWFSVAMRTRPARHYQTVARVFGEKRAEIVRDALSEEANEVVE